MRTPQEGTPMTYWIQWRDAAGWEGERRGPFPHREDAVRDIEENLEALAASLETWTGKRGWWVWNSADRAALWRDDMGHDEAPDGHFVIIEEGAPEARTDDDNTDTA